MCDLFETCEARRDVLLPGMTVLVPDDGLRAPSELDVATAVYGHALPRSPREGKWREHAHWVEARRVFLHRIDASARRALLPDAKA